MAPLEGATGPAPSDRSSEMDKENSSSGSSSSSSTSKLTCSSSSSSGSNSNVSNSAGAGTVADLKSVHDQENLQQGRGEEGGRSADANAAVRQVSQFYTRSARSQVGDAARPGEANGKLRSGDPVSSAAAATTGRSSGPRRRLSSASVASVESGASRGGRTSSAAVPNTADAHVRTGQLSRTGSTTRASTARSRVEVRGELEIKNVSSAQEVLHLLEDDSSPFAIHLQNVELRVSPGQSVRLGEAVPALREHLRRDLERQMHVPGSVREGHSPLSTGGRQNASRVGMHVGNSRTRSSNVLITGTVMGGVHPSLLGRSRQPAATAEVPTAPRPQPSAQREPAPARRIPSRMHTGLSAHPASGTTAAMSAGEVHAVSAAAVPAPLSASVAEQAQQQRASAETTSLVQQILEVQGQVKSLLAEEGLSPIAAEAAALKKKKGAQDDAEDEERGRRRILGSSGPHGSNMDEGSHNERAAQGGASSSSSIPPGSSSSSSSSSGSGIFARGRLVPKVVPAPQQNNEVTAVMKGTYADRDAAGEYAKFSEIERHRKLESAVEESSYTEVAEKGTAGGRRKSTQDEGDGKKKESDATEHEKEEKQHSRGSVVTVSGGERGQETLETNPAQAKKDITTEITAGEDVKQTPAKGSLEADSAKGSTKVTQEMQRGEGEEEGGRSQVAEESVQSRFAARAKERKQQIQEGTQKVTARGAEGRTTEDSKAQDIGTSMAKQKEGGAQQVFLKETKEDRRNSTGHEESVGTPADQTSAQPQLIDSAQQAAQGETRDSPEEKRAELPKVSIAHLRLKEEAEKIPSTEQQRAQAKEEAEKPSHQKSFLAKPEADGRSPRGGKGQTLSTEHREGESPKKPVTRESEAQQKATTEAAASAAPTFVQALSSFFSWALAEEETKPSPPPKDEVAADERKISAEVEDDKETGKVPATRPEGASAPKRTTAEEAGESVEEGQEKKKPRPKLKPKAAPARVSLSKRVTE